MRRFACFSLYAPFMGLALLAALPAQADVLTLVPDRDNTLFQDANGDTSNGAGPAFFAGRNGQNLTRRALIAFPVASFVPPGAVVDSARLRLHVSSAPDTVSHSFSLHRVLVDWGEGLSSSSGGGGAPATPGDATWLHNFYPGSFWSLPGGDFAPLPSALQIVGDIGDYGWSGAAMTADVQAWLDHPASNFGWLLQGDEGFSRTVRRFDSREGTDPSTRPALTVFFSIPVPVRASSWGALKARYR